MAWHPFRNLGMKLVAVGLGTMLWFTVSSDHLVERSVRVPLVFRAVPPGLEIAPDAPDSVEVHLRGRVSQLTGDQGDVNVYIDLADGRAGSRLFHLRTDQVTTPFGVEATQVFPSTVMLTLEVTGTRTVTVEPTVEGKPADGFEIGKVTVEPTMVVVLGPVRPRVVPNPCRRIGPMCHGGSSEPGSPARWARSAIPISTWPPPLWKHWRGALAIRPGH